MKKGKEIVEMNEKAIDAGANAYVKIDVPAEWANATDDNVKAASNGKEKLVKSNRLSMLLNRILNKNINLSCRREYYEYI